MIKIMVTKTTPQSQLRKERKISPIHTAPQTLRDRTIGLEISIQTHHLQYRTLQNDRSNGPSQRMTLRHQKVMLCMKIHHFQMLD